VGFFEDHRYLLRVFFPNLKTQFEVKTVVETIYSATCRFFGRFLFGFVTMDAGDRLI
jgi:hypothetical protein